MGRLAEILGMGRFQRRLAEILGRRRFQRRLALWAGGVSAVLLLVFLARFQPSWPWFSLWLFALLLGLAVLSLPKIQESLNLSWFGVTLLTLTGVALFDLYLFHVETHRQRSERLEIRGVYFDPDHRPIRVGVGYPDLDVRLEGSLYDFDRWALDIRWTGGEGFLVENPVQIYMLRTPSSLRWMPWVRGPHPVLGAELDWGGRSLDLDPGNPNGSRIRLEPGGKGGVLKWNGSQVALWDTDPFLNRDLSLRLNRGVLLSDLPWDSLPDRKLADDLVLTRTDPGRSLGRMRLLPPTYRLVSRSGGEVLGVGGPLEVMEGDTVWVNSRGKTWAFSLGRVPGVSRVAAPIAVHFVRRPRPAGWPLPSPETCGSDTHRCAVLSTASLPPPQAHFDLGGFGLDTARYAILARLETDSDGVEMVGAQEEVRFAYGQLHPLEAVPVSDDLPSAGVLVRVHRTGQGQQGAVFVTVVGLFLLIMGALAAVSGNPEIWDRRKATSPNMSAAWAFVNVVLIFLGVRLALGLRVAYSPPFYDRAAATAVGLWITFAVMLVALGRWSSWVGLFWRFVRWLERPLSRLFLPGVQGSEGQWTEVNVRRPGLEPGSEEERKVRGRDRLRSSVGLVLMTASIGLLLWQRPEAAASLVVAGVGVAAWLAMGISLREGREGRRDWKPLDVLTAQGFTGNPGLSLSLAAAGSVVLALAIHAPWMALVPVLLLLLLFGMDSVLSRWSLFQDRPRRSWALFAVILVLLQTGVLALFPWPEAGGAAVLGAGLGGVVLLRRPWGSGEIPLLDRCYEWFQSLRRALLAGMGWAGVAAVVGVLFFLSAQAIPPFVRFALVFLLFLLAIRAGLACHRLLERGGEGSRIQALGVLVIPLGVLLVFMLFDFGLGLVFFVPMFLTVLLAARIDRLPRTLLAASMGVAVLTIVFAWSVLNPSVQGLRQATDVREFSQEFQGIGNSLTDLLRAGGLSGPVTRASVRSIAASDPDLLEEALAFAGPSEALLSAAPSRNQVWGGRAYAASGLTGTGFAGTARLGRGVPTAVSYAENTFAVYILSEHGALGGVAVLAVYLSLLLVVGVWVYRVHPRIQDTTSGLAVLALTVGGVLWLVLPAVYVAASNLALVPLTGQNMPFLGLNSWADVVLVSGLSTGIIFSLVGLREPGGRSAGDDPSSPGRIAGEGRTP